MKHWIVRGRLVMLVIAAAMLLVPGVAFAQATPEASPDSDTAILRAADWLMSQQAADGGWVGFNGVSDAGVTIDAVLALVAAQNAGAEVDLTDATAFIESNGKAYARTGSGQAAKLVMAAVALGQDGRDFAGVDPFDIAVADYNSATNLYGTGVYDTALVMLAYAAMDEEVPGIIIDSMDTLQLADGSWAFDGTTTPGNGDTNTTAIVIQALVALDETGGDLILHGIEFLQSSQRIDGFPFQSGAGAMADANSTGIVVQALIAAGEEPSAQEWQNVSGALLSFQTDSGSFSYQLDPKEDNLFATVQVIPALAGQPYPITGSGSGESPASEPTCTADQREATPSADDELPCAA